MRELTKSMLSFSWAMSMFGLKQMSSALASANAAASFDAVTRCTEGQLGQMTRSAFRAGDNLQRGLVDLTLGFLTAGLRQPGTSRGDAGRGILDLAAGALAGGSRGVPSQPGGRALGGGTQAGGGTPSPVAQPKAGIQGNASQPDGWTQGGGTQGDTSQQGGWNQGGWTQGGTGEEGGWMQGGLPGDAGSPGGWSQGGLGGDGWTLSGDSGLGDAGNLTAQAMSGGIDDAAQAVESSPARQPDGTGGPQGGA